MALLLTTTNQLPPNMPYQVIGLVKASRDSTMMHNEKVDEVLAELEKLAARMGANAVIGVQVSFGQTNKGIVTVGLGTAVVMSR